MIPKQFAPHLNRHQRRNWLALQRQVQQAPLVGAGSFLMAGLLAPYMPKHADPFNDRPSIGTMALAAVHGVKAHSQSLLSGAWRSFLETTRRWRLRKV